ncbi:hypothetical protein KGF51_14610 [Clostridioides sp. ZZV14-6045]|uniref:hypothetical protein n=1 Tax=Clostridioides sp. ZZV14-6045 TaxID=2811489 RepID=UPI001D0FBCD6|nr:hypothetical protein [Clostridioides sp. ZZV14-6045]
MEEKDRNKEREAIKNSIIEFSIKGFIIGMCFMYMNNHMEASLMHYSLPSGKILFSIDIFPALKFVFTSILLLESFPIIIDIMHYYIENL